MQSLELQALAEGVASAGLAGVVVKRVGCLGLCAAGPLVRISSTGALFERVSPESIDGLVLALRDVTPNATPPSPPAPFFARQARVVTGNSGRIGPEDLDDYVAVCMADVALCHLEGLSDIGACRLCLVEVQGSGKLLPACVTRAEEGMQVTAHSEPLTEHRRTIIEMLFLERNHICSICVANNHGELQDLAPPPLALDIAHARLVVLIDACSGGVPGTVSIQRVEPSYPLAPAWSHNLDPAALVSLAEMLYGASAPVFLITVTGAFFGYSDQLSLEVSQALPKIADTVNVLQANTPQA